MTAPDWLTASQRAAYERGRAAGLASCADVAAPTVTDVTLDRGGFAERLHITWCLLHQGPADRCGCGGEALVEDHQEVELDTVAEILAATRHQLDLLNASTTSMADVATGGRL